MQPPAARAAADKGPRGSLTNKHPAQTPRLLGGCKKRCQHHQLAGVEDEDALQERCQCQLPLGSLLLQLSAAQALLFVMYLRSHANCLMPPQAPAHCTLWAIHEPVKACQTQSIDVCHQVSCPIVLWACLVSFLCHAAWVLVEHMLPVQMLVAHSHKEHHASNCSMSKWWSNDAQADQHLRKSFRHNQSLVQASSCIQSSMMTLCFGLAHPITLFQQDQSPHPSLDQSVCTGPASA